MCDASYNQKMTDKLQVDLQTGTICERILYGGSRYGGECVFVPKKDAVSTANLSRCVCFSDISVFIYHKFSITTPRPL